MRSTAGRGPSGTYSVRQRVERSGKGQGMRGKGQRGRLGQGKEFMDSACHKEEHK